MTTNIEWDWPQGGTDLDQWEVVYMGEYHWNRDWEYPSWSSDFDRPPPLTECDAERLLAKARKKYKPIEYGFTMRRYVR